MKRLHDMNLKELEDFFYDRASPQESARIEQWFVDNADKGGTDALLSELLRRMDVSAVDVDVDKAFRKLRHRINHAGLQNVSGTSRSGLRRIVQWAAASVIILLAAASVYYYAQSTRPKEWIEHHTAFGETKKVVLPDNSTIWLNVGSKVIYPKKFNNYIRQVYVTGEVFADVQKDRKRPFVLSAGEVNIKVLGTKFNVRSYAEDSQIEVTLAEGSVNMEIAFNNSISVYRLIPGDVVNFDKTTGRIDKYEVDTAAYKNWIKHGGLYFRDQTLKDIARYLERYFRVEIVITDPELTDYRFYASFVNGEDVNRILSTLNSSGTMKIYERNDIIYIGKAK